jgi:hypothetical protein
MKIFLSFFICLFLIGNYSIGGTIDPEIPDAKYVEYGLKYKYIVELCGEYNDNSLFCASAIVIKKNIILTAAHVVKDYKKCKVKIDDKQYIVKKFIWPKNLDKDVYGENDIAIGFVEGNIDLESYPELYENSDEDRKLCSISGYGLTGTFLSGAIKHDGKKRAGTNIIESVENGVLICNASKPEDKTKTELEFLIASGDSGGGLFIDNKLAGINSYVSNLGKDPPKSTYKTESGHIRISVHRDWILENTKE